MNSICLLLIVVLLVVWLIYRNKNGFTIWHRGLVHNNKVINIPSEALHQRRGEDPRIIYIATGINNGKLFTAVPKDHNLDEWKDVIPKIKSRFIVILQCGDSSIPDEERELVDYLLQFPNLIHIFSVNAKPSKFISPLPLGIDFHSKKYNSDYRKDEKKLINLYNSSLPIEERELTCLVGWTHNSSTRLKQRGYVKYDRAEYLNLFPKDIIKIADIGDRDKFWKECTESAFVICPSGNGIDTHRLWEVLTLGCIAIVQSTLLDPLMKEFAVVIIDDPQNLTKEDLEGFRQRLGWMCNDPKVRQKYTQEYWINFISSFI